jgi:hypothetical protein
VAIFVSYRRDDAGGHAGRLADRLTTRFGDTGVFMDVQDIAPGDKFAESIDHTIARCDAVVAVIGPRWVDLLQQRTPEGEDFVRHEIASALRRDIPVFPVLVGGARMPARGELPADLAPLLQRHAIEIRDGRFDDDVAPLVEALAGTASVSRGGSRRRLGARAYVALSALLVAMGIAAVVTTRPAEVSLDGTWIAEMQKPGQPAYRIRLDLIRSGERITGMVRYPTGDGIIDDGRLNGSQLSFSTSHVPQFASSPATIRYEGEVTEGGIRLTAVDAAGVATGVAKKPSD